MIAIRDHLRTVSGALFCGVLCLTTMVEANDYPLEDRLNILWFNQLMEEQAARYAYHAVSALQETEDAHLIWNAKAYD